MRHCSKSKVVSTEVVRSMRGQTDFSLKYFWFNGRDDTLGHPILQSEDIAEVTFKSIGPKVRPGRGINQLADDADFSRCLAYTAFKHVADAEFAPDLLDIAGFALVSKTRIAGDPE